MTDSNHNATSPIFAIPRHPYTSYQDLYRLIELSGFPTVFLDEIDPDSDNTYVMTIANGENQAGWHSPRASIYLLDLEWHLDGVHIPGVKAVLAGDKWYSERIGARYTPIGSHPDLAIDPGDSHAASAFDVAYIGYFDGVPRRQVIRQQLITAGVKVSPTGAWGYARAALLRQSKAYLCVHQLENAPTIAPLRMVVAAAYGLPVITETVADAGIFDSHIRQLHYDHLAVTLPHLLLKGEFERLTQQGMELHRALCERMTFRKSVESAL